MKSLKAPLFVWVLSVVCLKLACGAPVAERGTEADYPWLNNSLGISHTVPAPWTPVQLDGDTISVWGRTIRYGGTLMPAQITSQGVELLASPIAVLVSVNERPVVLGEVQTEVVSRRPDQVVVRAVAASPSLECETVTTIEFDGMVKIALVVTPRRAVTIDRLQVTIPIRKEVAEVYGCYLQYDFTQLRTDKKSFINCMQGIGGPIHSPFNPEIWIGNRTVGLTWAAETNCQWDQEHPENAISVLPGEASTDLVLNVVDHRIALVRPKAIEFALFPTPLKPVNPRLRQIRLAAFGRIAGAFKAGVSPTTYDYYAIAWAGEVQPVYVSLPWSLKNEKHLDFRRRMRELNIKYIPYGALWYTNAVMEAGRRFYEQWHVKPVSESTLKRWARYDAGETRDLSKGHWDGYRVCAWPRSYADFVVWTYTRAIETEGLDGIYFDHGEVTVSCENPNHNHFQGCTGRQRKLYFGVFSARELLKRLWIAAKAIKPDLVIVQHQSRTLKSLNSFIDVAVTGEVMNVVFAGSTTSRLARENPLTYNPDYDRIPGVIMSYDYLDSFGFESRILPQIKYVIEDYWKAHPGRYQFLSQKLLRYTLLNGTRMWRAI